MIIEFSVRVFLCVLYFATITDCFCLLGEEVTIDNGGKDAQGKWQQPLSVRAGIWMKIVRICQEK